MSRGNCPNMTRYERYCSIYETFEHAAQTIFKFSALGSHDYTVQNVQFQNYFCASGGTIDCIN